MIGNRLCVNLKKEMAHSAIVYSTLLPSHNCQMLLWGRISSTSLSGSKLEGKQVKGYLSQERYPNSLERKLRFPEKFKFHNMSNLRRLICAKASALNVIISCISSIFSGYRRKTMASRFPVAYSIANNIKNIIYFKASYWYILKKWQLKILFQ